MYGFTLTIEIIVRHYCRLSLLLILQSNNLYRCLNYNIVYCSIKGFVYIFISYIHTYLKYCIIAIAVVLLLSSAQAFNFCFELSTHDNTRSGQLLNVKKF